MAVRRQPFPHLQRGRRQVRVGGSERRQRELVGPRRASSSRTSSSLEPNRNSSTRGLEPTAVASGAATRTPARAPARRHSSAPAAARAGGFRFARPARCGSLLKQSFQSIGRRDRDAEHRHDPAARAAGRSRLGRDGHGELYASEFGWDTSLRRSSRRSSPTMPPVPAANRTAPGSPSSTDGGSAACSAWPTTNQRLRLRILLVDPVARGQALGSRLVATAIAFARDVGYRRMRLWTNDPLLAARRVYLRHGFTLTDEHPHHSFGVELVARPTSWSSPDRSRADRRVSLRGHIFVAERGQRDDVHRARRVRRLGHLPAADVHGDMGDRMRWRLGREEHEVAWPQRAPADGDARLACSAAVRGNWMPDAS